MNPINSLRKFWSATRDWMTRDNFARLWKAVSTLETLPAGDAAQRPVRPARRPWRVFEIERLDDLPEPPRAAGSGAFRRLFSIETLEALPPQPPRAKQKRAVATPLFSIEKLEALPEPAKAQRDHASRDGVFTFLFGVDRLPPASEDMPRSTSSILKWLFWPESPGPSQQNQRRR